MDQKVPQLAIWAMWLALPFTALRYWQAWDRLPMRMAVHFNAAWQANGWTSRDGAFRLAMVTTIFVVLVLTIGNFAARAAAKPALTAWTLLAFSYLVVGFVCVVNDRVVEYNLKTPQRPVLTQILQPLGSGEIEN